MAHLTAAGHLGPMGIPIGLTHAGGGGHQALLKAPQELHRDDLKQPLGGGPSGEERLVSFVIKIKLYYTIN